MIFHELKSTPSGISSVDFCFFRLFSVENSLKSDKSISTIKDRSITLQHALPRSSLIPLTITQQRHINPNTECPPDVPREYVQSEVPALLKWRYIAADYKRPFTTYEGRTAHPTMHGAFPLFNHDKSIRTHVGDCTLTSYRSTATWLSNGSARCKATY